jgi:hypothetical protein
MRMLALIATHDREGVAGREVVGDRPRGARREQPANQHEGSGRTQGLALRDDRLELRERQHLWDRSSSQSMSSPARVRVAGFA